MSGQLREHPLVELVEEISTEKLTGALRLERERMKSVIYLEDGEIIYAASNVRVHRLSACIQRWGLLTEAEVMAIHDHDSDRKLSAALVATGTFTGQQVLDMVTRQVTEIMQFIFLWTEGNWSFDPRVRLVEGVRVEVSVPSLSVEAARQLPGEFIASRLVNRDETLFPVVTKVPTYDLLPTEAFVLSRIDTPTRMSELIWGSGLPELETLRMIYSLALGGYLRRETPPKAFSNEALVKAKAAKAQIPATPLTGPPPPALEMKKEEVASVKAADPIQEPDIERQELDRFFTQVTNASDYYEILGVRRRATIAEIKSAYHVMAKRFHPDRYHRETENGLHGRVESAFTEVARAYETLKEKQSRATYDLKLQNTARLRGGTPGEARPPKKMSGDSVSRQKPMGTSPGQGEQSSAQAKFEEGIKVLKMGDFNLALALLGEAAKLVPTEPKYRAFYGQALARQERTRRSAEAEIQAAITLDSKNVSYRIMLAELYRDLGFSKRATGELERALSLEPRNSEALRLLKTIKGSGSS